ncbi:MAG: bifunctional [glutamate--ammonia ligase]-adenylyl-L-tyrosine phosphorylase/[glutamate--ammonia-ligase] adenylyltransferase [Desulfuromonadales bacterium]|nr:bifunctional [glutamate--ammonia ligase]-adenylyl-L-tyrosine phosphorylase/[glutamate--ammonia-ligase] adenylyltransferase [Desulfuromonadales bacterium]
MITHAQLLERLGDLNGVSGRDGWLSLAADLGLVEIAKSATNLQELHERLASPALLAVLIGNALAAADPDQALNGLERFCSVQSEELLHPILHVAQRRQQLVTILGASPFLTNILCRDEEFPRRLLIDGKIDGIKSEEEMLAELRDCIPDSVDFVTLQKGLRRYKCREILRIAGRDLCGLDDLARTTYALSALAGVTLQRSCDICGRLLQTEYGAPLLDSLTGDERVEAEFTVFGMGKFGGRELNFSSDIDLIYFYTSEKGMTAGVPAPAGGMRNQIHLHQYFSKLADLVSKAVGQATEDGFVFRVDLRLRPEGNSGEMATPLRSAEIYYEHWGQSWERAAMIKARPVAGSIPLGEQLLKSLEPFIFRRYLDYGMVEDIKGMKQKIDHNLTREREGERNLKLGRGGIREIEFFIQALQLIYAGKQPELREKGSMVALDKLVEAGLVRAEEATLLREAYTFLRTVEHRIQVVQERQTHNLPASDAELLVLARRSGFSSLAEFSATLERHRQGVHTIFHDLFYSGEATLRDETRPEILWLFDSSADADLVMDYLEEQGFKNPTGAYESLLALRDGPKNSPMTERARRHFERIAPLLMQEVLGAPEPEMALRNLERFLGALRARATFYALLAENRTIITLLVSLFATSQFLSRIFIQHPEILDALVSSSYSVTFKERGVMAAELAAQLALHPEYEDQLAILRRFHKEETLRIGLNDIHGNTRLEESTLQLSALADVCLRAAVEMAQRELLPRYGLPWVLDDDGQERPAGFVIVGMGKLGGMELNYHSDLDIIFIHEGSGETKAAPGCDPERFRLQTNQEYFSRLAQRIISVLTLKTPEGALYEIDTRLRPSGNQGPLVTSLAAYREYHQTTAQPWERQALIKARVVCGPPELTEKIDELNRQIVYDRELPENLAGEIRRLRERMESVIAREGVDHFNIKTGRGGMVDVEFIVQYLQLRHGGAYAELQGHNTLAALKILQQTGLLAADDFATLLQGYEFLRRLENKLRLIHDESISALSGEPAYLRKLAQRLGYPDRPQRADELFLAEYRQMTTGIRTVFAKIF